MTSSTKSISYRTSKLSKWGEFLYRKQVFSGFLEHLIHYVSVRDKEILDAGCGYGSASYSLSKLGANVMAIDIDGTCLDIAKRFCSNRKIDFLRNNSENLAFKNESFDLIILFGVLEHVKDPEKTLIECSRVLREGGYLFVDYNPYYSIAGHHLYDYTILPVQFLPEKIVRSYVLGKRFNPFNPKKFESKQEELAHKIYCLKVYHELNKISVGQFCQILKKLRSMTILEEGFVIQYPGGFKINLSFMKYLGPLKELAFSHWVIAKKKVCKRITYAKPRQV